MAKRPTVADLARQAGVSVATVDRGLNRRLPVRDDTAQRVVEAAERIGYHATGLLKQRLSEAPQRTFGFLLQRRSPFYLALGAALVEATRSATFIRGRAVVEHVEEIVPSTIAEQMRALALRVDALAVVAVDHPTVNAAIADIAADGKPVFALLTDVTAPGRAGCLSVDRHKSGRTAAWAISRLARRAGKVAILIGSHRYLSQEVSEISFRSYMREHASEFTVLESIINLDDQRVSYEAVTQLIAANPDLVGIYSAGGGEDGLARALRDEGAGRGIIAVCNELTVVTRQALIDRVIDLVLGTPITGIAQRAVEVMAEALVQQRHGLVQVLLPADLHISENI